MIIHKTPFFLILILLAVCPFIAARLVWLSGTVATTGTYGFAGRGQAGDQMPLDYSFIFFRVGKEIVWIKGLGNLGLHTGDSLPVRYRVDDPADARVGTFAGIWGDVLVYGGIPVFILLIIYLHPAVVPWRSRLRVTLKRPYIRLL